MKIFTIVGARPQFIKAAPVCRVIKEYNANAAHSADRLTEVLVHTGQHYDDNLSEIFFRDLGLRKPDYNLGVGSGPHGRQTAEMLMRIEEVLISQKPDCVVVYGDTNSTLAGALAACKLRIPMVHVEAGLRSYNRQMPEEHNRVLTDHCADLLFCPTKTAVKNLKQEGITQGVHLVGDTMYDAILHYGEIARRYSTILDDLRVKPGKYLLATVHRPYNTDVPGNLKSIMLAFQEIGETIIFPVHPRTRAKIIELDGTFADSNVVDGIKFVEPVGYLDMLMLEQNARVILTDSGGMQKEAYFLGVPCVTLRPETEWVETVKAGWNVVVGNDRSKIAAAVQSIQPSGVPGLEFGDGRASNRILEVLLYYLPRAET